jgi:hypothetical protein
MANGPYKQGTLPQAVIDFLAGIAPNLGVRERYGQPPLVLPETPEGWRGPTGRIQRSLINAVGLQDYYARNVVPPGGIVPPSLPSIPHLPTGDLTRQPRRISEVAPLINPQEQIPAAIQEGLMDARERSIERNLPDRSTQTQREFMEAILGGKLDLPARKETAGPRPSIPIPTGDPTRPRTINEVAALVNPQEQMPGRPPTELEPTGRRRLWDEVARIRSAQQPAPAPPSERDIRRQQLEERIATIDARSKELETPTEMPTGAAGWGEAILSRLSRGDAGAIHAERERKREKALGLLQQKRQRLVGEEGKIYTRGRQAKIDKLDEDNIRSNIAYRNRPATRTTGHRDRIVTIDGENYNVRDYFFDDRPGEVIHTSLLSPADFTPQQRREYSEKVWNEQQDVIQKHRKDMFDLANNPYQEAEMNALFEQYKSSVRDISTQLGFMTANDDPEGLWMKLIKQREELDLWLNSEIPKILLETPTEMPRGPLPPGVSPGEQSIIGPAGDIQVIRNGRWVPLQ